MQRNCSADARCEERTGLARLFWLSLPSVALAGAVACISGCGLPALNQHAVAFDAATRLVIDGSEDSYTAANRLHHEVMVQQAVSAYGPAWNPHTALQPLLTPDQLDARIKVLDGLKAYAASLVELTSGKPPSGLSDAASGVGTNVQALSGTVTTDFALAIPAMSTGSANAVSTAVLALGEFLTSSKTKQGLATITARMNPTVTTLCELLNSDIKVLRSQAGIDYNQLIDSENQLLLHESGGDPFVRRAEIARLIGLAEQQRANDELLKKLQTALHTLDLTHQALAAAGQGNNPATIKQKIADLQAAGESLSTFYKSLPTS